MNRPLEGLVAATHTPFHPDGSLAPEGVARQAGHLAAQGVGTVFITGSTGEWASLTTAERLRIYEAWAEAGPSNGLRVIAHVGDTRLEDARRFSAAAADFGFDGISALAPCYFKPASVSALVDWCAVLAGEAPGLPFYYYDIPSMTGVHLDPVAFLREGGRRIPNLAGIKFTNPDLDLYRRCLEMEDGRFDLPWGIDERLVEALAAGACGAVGSTYNFAAPLYEEMIRRFRAGEVEAAERLQAESVRLVEILAEPGYFGAAKCLMDWLGVPVGPARPPLANPDPLEREKLRERLGEIPRYAGLRGAGCLSA